MADLEFEFRGGSFSSASSFPLSFLFLLRPHFPLPLDSWLKIVEGALEEQHGHGLHEVMKVGGLEPSQHPLAPPLCIRSALVLQMEYVYLCQLWYNGV